MRFGISPSTYSRVRNSVLLAVVMLLITTASTSSSQPTAPILPLYPNSEAGLKHLIQDSLAAAKANDQAKLADLANSMVLPSPVEWFSKIFGPEWGGVYAKLYEDNKDHAASNLANIFSEMAAQKFSIDDVRQFKNSCDFGANQDEYPMLAARVVSEPFSLVRFAKGKDVRTLRFFAYVDGGFRFLGLLKVPTDLYPEMQTAIGLKSGSTAKPLSVDANVQLGKLIHRVEPIYPEIVYANTSPDHRFVVHPKGEVILHAIINADGSVGALRVLRGQCPFAEATIHAVKQWRFSPTLRDGVPTKVQTTIDMSFMGTPPVK
jgi:TonB family protein